MRATAIHAAAVLAFAAAIETSEYDLRSAVIDSHGDHVIRRSRDVREVDEGALLEAQLAAAAASGSDEKIFFNSSFTSDTARFLNQTVVAAVSRLGNETIDAQASETSENASETTVAQAMRVKLDGKGDERALGSTVLFAVLGMACIIASFRSLRATYPILYSKRELERIEDAQRAESLRPGDQERAIYEADDAVGPSMLKQLRSAWSLQDEHVIEVAGLDACMHLQFQALALKVLVSLMVVPAVLCPVHKAGSSNQSEFFAAISWTVHEDRYGVLWLHCVTVWFVVLVVTRHLCRAQERFLPLRYAWLRRLRPPQATTVIVEGIPSSLRTDARLAAYLASLFSEEAILRSYVVRKSKRLESKLGRLEYAEQKLKQAITRLDRDADREQLKNIQEELAAESARVARAADFFDPEVCSNAGIVTFRTYRDVRLALREQLSTDRSTLSMKVAPAPEDIWYDSLQMAESVARNRMGWLCILGLFAAFAPLVVFVSSLVRLDTLVHIAPVLADLKRDAPVFASMLEGILATGALNTLMAATPLIFYIVCKSFFRPLSYSDVQLRVQNLYFTFLVFFVLLVTAFTQGVLSTLWLVAQQPAYIVSLLARSLPLASHFYVNYVTVGCLSCTYELIRFFPLLKFLSLKELVGEKEAKQKAEIESVEFGSRVGKSTMMLVISIVFCSLCPVILIVGSTYFFLERISHGYLCYYAEPKQPDLGGRFWVQALLQVHCGLVIYILLMVGVVGASGIEFIICLVPSLLVVANSWLHLVNTFLWECLPLDGVLDQDSYSPASSSGQEKLYEQPEVRKCREVLWRLDHEKRPSNASSAIHDEAEATEDTDPVSTTTTTTTPFKKP